MNSKASFFRQTSHASKRCCAAAASDLVSLERFRRMAIYNYYEAPGNPGKPSQNGIVAMFFFCRVCFFSLRCGIVRIESKKMNAAFLGRVFIWGRFF